MTKRYMRSICVPIATIVVIFAILYLPVFTGEVAKTISNTLEERAKTAKHNIIFDNMFLDLGKVVRHGKAVECKFSFANQSSHNIQIHSVICACGCTSVVFSKEVIEPGQKGSIVLKFSPKNEAARFHTSAAVRFRHDPTQIYKLELAADLVEAWRIDPPELILGSFNRHVRNENSFRIINLSPEPINIKSLESEETGFKWSLSNGQIAPDSFVDVNVWTLPSIKEGPLGNKITVNTDSPSIPSRQIYVTGWSYNGNVFALPKKIVFGFMCRGDYSSRTIKIKTIKDGGSFRIVDVSSEELDIEARYEPNLSKEHELHLSIHLPDDATLGQQEDDLNIIVLDENGKHNSICVPMQLYIQTRQST